MPPFPSLSISISFPVFFHVCLSLAHSVSFTPTCSSFPPSPLKPKPSPLPNCYSSPTALFVATHSPRGQHGRVVVDVRDSDDGSGCVGKAKVQVALHVRSLHDDGILGYFLWKKETENKQCAVICKELSLHRVYSNSHRLTPQRNKKLSLCSIL